MNALEKSKVIGIIGAMDVEVEGIVGAMEARAVTSIGGSNFYSGKISGRAVVAVQSGIGKVNAAFAAAVLALEFKADAIIMSGIAGDVSGLKPLDAFVADGFIQHDVSVLSCEDGHIDIVNAVVIQSDKELSDALALACNAKRGLMATGEQFVDSKEQIETILAKFPQAKAVDMESAAVAQVCARLGLPFACVKIISDDGTSGDVYYDFKTAAADKAVGAVLSLIKP